jgi:hypothetical protein
VVFPECRIGKADPRVRPVPDYRRGSGILPRPLRTEKKARFFLATGSTNTLRSVIRGYVPYLPCETPILTILRSAVGTRSEFALLHTRYCGCGSALLAVEDEVIAIDEPNDCLRTRRCRTHFDASGRDSQQCAGMKPHAPGLDDTR